MSSLPSDRRARLAAELRANLKRRKAQSRLRQTEEKSTHASDPIGCSSHKSKKDEK